MAKITFKAKVKQSYFIEGGLDCEYIQIPTLTRNHCDMSAFRKHGRYGGFANSDLFPGMLARIKTQVFGNKSIIRLDDIPEGVSVDTSGFLAVVSFNVED